jgi:hypothetical protein
MSKMFYICSGLALIGQSLFIPTAFAAAGTISANPNPCAIYAPDNWCNTTIQWTSQGTTSVKIYVKMNQNPEQLFASAGGGGPFSQLANWIQSPPNYYYFYLYDYSTGTRGALLSIIQVVALVSTQCNLNSSWTNNRLHYKVNYICASG